MDLFKSLLHKQPQMKVFKPETPRAAKEIHPVVNLQNVEFQSPDEVMAQNVTAEELSRLIGATEQRLRQLLTHSSIGYGLRVRYTIYHDKPVGIDLGINVSIEGTTLREDLQVMFDSLNALDEVKMTARQRPVTLYAYFQVNQTPVSG